MSLKFPVNLPEKHPSSEEIVNFSLVECEGRLVNSGASARNDGRRRSQRGADHERVGSGGDGTKTARKDERTVG